MKIISYKGRKRWYEGADFVLVQHVFPLDFS